MTTRRSFSIALLAVDTNAGMQAWIAERSVRFDAMNVSRDGVAQITAEIGRERIVMIGGTDAESPSRRW